jgi:hypothetical protein
MITQETLTNRTDRLLLILVERKAMQGESRDYWLRPDEELEVRAEIPTDEDHFHLEDIPEGILVGYFGDMEYITVWQGDRELDCGYQRPDGWPEFLLAEVRSLAEQATADHRLYRLNFNREFSWVTGRLPDRRQVLLLPGAEQVFLQVFDVEGRPLEKQTLPLPGWEYEFGSSRLNVQSLYEQLARAIGFVPAPIDVRRFSFSLPNSHHYPLSVQPLPDVSEEQLFSWRRWGYGEHWLDCLEDVIKLREWFTEGRYVLNFGNNYWLDREGKVTDS